MQKILFIEDDLIFLKAYATKLKMEGLEVTAVDNCDEALELIKKDCPDLIILDIMLKGKKNGFDFLELVKADPCLSKIPVIVLTNLDSEEKVAKEIGAVAYLTKTKTDPKSVSNYIKKILSKN